MQAAIVSLATHVLQHPDTLGEVTRLFKDVIALLVQDPDTVQSLTDLTLRILADDRTKASFVALLTALTQEQEVRF